MNIKNIKLDNIKSKFTPKVIALTVLVAAGLLYAATASSITLSSLSKEIPINGNIAEKCSVVSQLEPNMVRLILKGYSSNDIIEELTNYISEDELVNDDLHIYHYKNAASLITKVKGLEKEFNSEKSKLSSEKINEKISKREERSMKKCISDFK